MLKVEKGAEGAQIAAAARKAFPHVPFYHDVLKNACDILEGACVLGIAKRAVREQYPVRKADMPNLVIHVATQQGAVVPVLDGDGRNGDHCPAAVLLKGCFRHLAVADDSDAVLLGHGNGQHFQSAAFHLLVHGSLP